MAEKVSFPIIWWIFLGILNFKQTQIIAWGYITNINQPWCGYNGDMLVYIAVTNKMMVCFVERQGICPVSDFIKNGPVAGKLSQNYCNKSWSLQSIHFESPIIFTKIAWTIKLCGYPVLKPTPKLSLGLKILLIINGCRINETGKMGFIRKLRGCWEFATHDFAAFYQKHWGDQSTTKSRYKLNFAAMTQWNLTLIDYAHAISSGSLLMRCSISECFNSPMKRAETWFPAASPSCQAHVPWIQDMFLSLWMQSWETQKAGGGWPVFSPFIHKLKTS